MASTTTHEPPARTAYAARLSRKRIVVTMVAAMSGMFLASLDSTIVSTAMPTIVVAARSSTSFSSAGWTV